MNTTGSTHPTLVVDQRRQRGATRLRGRLTSHRKQLTRTVPSVVMYRCDRGHVFVVPVERPDLADSETAA